MPGKKPSKRKKTGLSFKPEWLKRKPMVGKFLRKLHKQRIPTWRKIIILTQVMNTLVEKMVNARNSLERQKFREVFGLLDFYRARMAQSLARKRERIRTINAIKDYFIRSLESLEKKEFKVIELYLIDLIRSLRKVSQMNDADMGKFLANTVAFNERINRNPLVLGLILRESAFFAFNSENLNSAIFRLEEAVRILSKIPEVPLKELKHLRKTLNKWKKKRKK
jgi:hypothetical protein